MCTSRRCVRVRFTSCLIFSLFLFSHSLFFSFSSLSFLLFSLFFSLSFLFSLSLFFSFYSLYFLSFLFSLLHFLSVFSSLSFHVLVGECSSTTISRNHRQASREQQYLLRDDCNGPWTHLIPDRFLCGIKVLRECCRNPGQCPPTIEKCETNKQINK